MYQTRFGLHQRPFPATPDTSSYYPASEHEEALALMLNAIHHEDGVVLLTGATGTGKTLLAHCLLERMDADTDNVVFLTGSRLESRKDLLQAILFDLGLPHENSSEQELRLRLTEALLAKHSSGQQSLFIVDDAHELSVEALLELRSLGNLEAGRRKAVQVLLAGATAVLQLLSVPHLQSFAQRVGVRAKLEPLGPAESIDYLQHHVRIAGGHPASVFSDEALEMLATGCQGIARLLNLAAHQCVDLADQMEASQVDAEVALEVLTDLGLEIREDHEREHEAPAEDALETAANAVALDQSGPPRLPA